MSSVKYFQYPKLYIFLSIFFGGTAYLILGKKWTSLRKLVNGIMLLVYFFILGSALSLAHMDYAMSPSNMTQAFNVVWRGVFLVAVLFGFLLIMSSTGRIFYRRLLKNHINGNPVLDIGLGFMLFTLILFILGALGLFRQNFILAVLFLLAVFNISYLVGLARELLFRPIDLKGYNLMGVLSFLIVVYVLVFHFLYNIAPFPSGFDSRNFYMNISKLLADNGHLVEGFQPYNWSLVMGIGFAIAGKVGLALELSYIGIVLTMIAAYRFAVKRLLIDKNMVLFCLAIFILIPAVNNQMYTELKVDFAMLFFQILSLEYALILAKRVSAGIEKNDRKLVVRLLPLTLLVGILCSFALGIKLINMFLVFTIVVLLWWSARDKFGTAGAVCLTLLLFLFAGIDELSGLDKYHLSEGIVKIILVIVMLGGFAMSFVRHRHYFIKRASITAVFIIATGVLILPWMIKNYVETNSINPRILLMGEDPGPSLNEREIINNYERYINNR